MSDHPLREFVTWQETNGVIDLTIKGYWVLANYRQLRQVIDQARPLFQDQTLETLDASGLQGLDTAGAQCLLELLGQPTLEALKPEQSGLTAERFALVETVARAIDTIDADPAVKPVAGLTQFFGDIGIGLVNFWHQAIGLIGFSGLTLQALILNVLRPKTWRVTAIVAQVHETGLNAVPIIALLTFLVGAVVAFLGATILADFGATVYTVNLVGFSFLREFAVLLTAILMAGRTASAFTAQIGSMKVNEEIDAIRVQGLSPINLLVLPRVLALQISLPILTFVGMLSGIIGGMAVCALALDIPPQRFLDIFVDEVRLRHFVLGMAKAPIFAFLIAVIGCLQGFRVGGSAQSVGERTTAAVVHSIFVVIVLDALAALFFMEMGW